MNEELEVLEDQDGPRRCYYCEHMLKACPDCQGRSGFVATKEALEFRGLDR